MTEHLYSLTHDRHYVACRLRHVLTLTALGKETEQYQREYLGRQAEFLTCLLNPGDERVTYDLRLIAHPDPGLHTRGTVTLALLCRLDQVSADDACRHARHLLHLLTAYFSEYSFESVEAADIATLLRPFDLHHVITLTRRAAWERLDSLQSGPRRQRLGFLQSETAPRGQDLPPDTIFHLYPFLPRSVPMNTLFKLLLLHSEPTMISVRLRPTRLDTTEERFLEDQISSCERHAQIQIGHTSEEHSILRTTLQEAARLYQRHLVRLLFGLRDNAALMTLEVASPAPIPIHLADALGALVTEQAGGSPGDTDEGLHRCLAGGYEVGCRDERPHPDDIAALTQLDLALTPHPLAPSEAGRILYLVDTSQAVAAFRLPPATIEVPPGLPVQGWRSQPAPKNVPLQGCLLGINSHDGTSQSIRIGPEDRRRHVYVVGQTGTGKTTLLKSMILNDIKDGMGLCVIDPHGDLFRDLLGKIPNDRIEDVVLLDPTDLDWPVGLNMLEYQTPEQRHFLAQELVGIMIRLVQDEFGLIASGQMIGPLFVQHMRMNLLLTMSDPDDPGTLLEFYNIFQEKGYWRRWLPLTLSDPLLDRWVKNVLPKFDYTQQGSEGTSMGGYVGSKFEGFIYDPMLRNIFGQKRSSIDLRRIMDDGKILLVNLAKGELTEPNARFLGMVLMAKLMAAAMGRVGIPEQERRDFHLYVDEFQAIATDSFVTMLSEARKFGLSLVLANQFLSQVTDPRIVQAIFGNVGTIVAFRMGQADAELMEREFFPAFTRFDLTNLPNWQAYMTTLINGETVRPFSLHTVPDTISHDPGMTERVRSSSRKTVGRSSRQAETDIARSFYEERVPDKDAESGDE